MQKTKKVYPIKIVLDHSCEKEFKSSLCKTGRVPPNLQIDEADFTERVNEYYHIVKDFDTGLIDGDEPYCKHIIMENFVDCYASYAEIKPENVEFIKTDFVTRGEEDKPVVTRWLDRAEVPRTKAKYLDIKLYSKEQIQAECKEEGEADLNDHIDYDYAIMDVNR